MRRHFRHGSWSYWAGTLDDLLSPLHTAVQYISEHGSSEDQGTVAFDATVILRRQQIDADSYAELRESLRDHDIPDIRSMTVKVGNSTQLRVDLDVTRHHDVLELRTSGTHEVHVNGLHSSLSDELHRGSRRLSYGAVLLLRVLAAVMVGVLLPYLILSSGVITSTPTGETASDFLGGQYETVEYTGPLWAFLGPLVLIAVGLIIFLWGHTIALADLELLQQGQRTRYESVRPVVWALIATLILGPLAGIAWAVWLRQ